MRKTLTFGLIICLVLVTLSSTAFAASEVDTAASYLKEHGIFVGDESGNLNLDKSLTRVELAVILTRLDYLSTPGGLAEWDDWGEEYFSDPQNRYNTFTDVPAWAMPFVEYCYQRGLMVGVGNNLFDAQGKVNPQMAATVILRYCGIQETDWSYQTSVTKAQSVGISPTGGMDSTIVLRGTMAVIIYRGINYAETGTIPSEPTPEPTPSQPVSPPAGETGDMSIDEMKAEIVRLTNEARAEAGLVPLEVLPELMDCAQAKAQDMIDTGYYAHNSPNYGTHNEMIRLFVPSANGGWENTTFGSAASPAEAFQYWMDSPGHCATILETKTTHIGVGFAMGEDGRYAWVQQFVSL